MFIIKHEEFENLANQEEFVSQNLAEALAEMKENGEEWEEGEPLFWSYDFSIDTSTYEDICDIIFDVLAYSEKEEILKIQKIAENDYQNDDMTWLFKIFSLLNITADVEELIKNNLYYQAVLGEDYNLAVGGSYTKKDELIQAIITPYWEMYWVSVYDGKYPQSGSTFGLNEQLQKDILGKIEDLLEQ